MMLKKINKKSILVSLIIVLHILIMMWYYNHTSTWCYTNQRLSYSVFYSSFICIAINMMLSTIGKLSFLTKQFLRIHSVFILGLGTTYILSYSGIITIESLERFYYTLGFALVLFGSIIYSAITNKFFKYE